MEQQVVVFCLLQDQSALPAAQFVLIQLVLAVHAQALDLVGIDGKHDQAVVGLAFGGQGSGDPAFQLGQAAVVDRS